MGVLFQAFYWNCPSQENQDGNCQPPRFEDDPGGRTRRLLGQPTRMAVYAPQV